MPSATETPQPKGVFWNSNAKNILLRNKNRIRKEEESAESGQASPDSLLRAAPPGQNPRQVKILTPRTSGLAQSFCLPPHNPPCCCFFSVTLFAIHPQLAHCFFSFLKKINKPIHPQAKKKSGTPTATTVPEMRQKKTTQSYIYIMLSYIRALAWRQINRAKYNLIMYNSRTKSTLLPRSAARRTSRVPHHPSVVQKIKKMELFVCHVLAVYDFHFRSIPFQELRSFLTLTPDTAFHFHSNHNVLIAIFSLPLLVFI